MKSKRMKYKRTWNHHTIKMIRQNGVCCCSVVDSGKTYIDPIWEKKEPKGEYSKEYRDKRYNQGKILRKLGLWMEPYLGINLEQLRKQRLYS